ncbi:putative cytochrome b5-like heme/steroid binding domain-containing protein [Helianthus anomalus]
MAVQLLETLEQSITAFTGLSPATFITLLALSVAGYYAVSGFFAGDNHPPPRSRSYEEDMPPVQLGEVSEEELKGYNGNDPKKPLLMAIKGQIFDVSQSRMFYGPGGPYALFAGKDASRALAKMSFEEKDLNGDLTGLGVFELEALQDWEYKFMNKYVKVGTIKKPEPAPEPTTNDQPAESSSVASNLTNAFSEMNRRLQDIYDLGAQRIEENREVTEIMRDRQWAQDFEFYSKPHDHLTGKALKMAIQQKERIEKKYNL